MQKISTTLLWIGLQLYGQKKAHLNKAMNISSSMVGVGCLKFRILAWFNINRYIRQVYRLQPVGVVAFPEWNIIGAHE